MHDSVHSRHWLGAVTLGELEAEMLRLARLIGAGRDELPTLEASDQDGRPHLELDVRGYHWVVCERGSELQRRTTAEADEVLYWVFESVTHSLAFEYELRNRVSGEDCRRVGFAKQLELLGKLSTRWEQKCAARHAAILAENPFVDS